VLPPFIITGERQRWRVGADCNSVALYVKALTSGNGNVFSDFMKALTGSGLPQARDFPIAYLMPQVIQGHRLWCGEFNEDERFYAIDKLFFKQGSKQKELWLDLIMQTEDLSRFGMSSKGLLNGARINALYRHVQYGSVKVENAETYQLSTPIPFNSSPADKLMKVVDTIRPNLWVNVLDIPPYRKYYLYCSPDEELNSRLPQLLSLYALMFYFGSITRYRPQEFQGLLTSSCGTWIHEFLNNIPGQFIYLMASEFADQDVTKAAIIT